MSYFIMLTMPNDNGIMPLVDENNNVIIFDTAIAAHKAVSDNMVAEAYGYIIYENRNF